MISRASPGLVLVLCQHTPVAGPNDSDRYEIYLTKVVGESCPMINARCSWNSAPCKGFVKKSARLCPWLDSRQHGDCLCSLGRE